jgi:hypothetical protein
MHNQPQHPKPHYSDAYIKSVASKPYSKDPTIRRPLEYTMEKLTHVMEWREGAGAPEFEDLVKLANGPETAPEAVEDPAKLAKAKALARIHQGGKTHPMDPMRPQTLVSQRRSRSQRAHPHCRRGNQVHAPGNHRLCRHLRLLFASPSRTQFYDQRPQSIGARISR